MNEHLFTTTFTAEAQVTADGVHQIKLPFGADLVGVSVCAEAFTGSPTGFNVDIQDDGTDVVTAVAADTAKTPGTWLSKHLGGSNAPVHFAKDSVVDIDINLVGGSTPTADYTILLFWLSGEA
jgi:hypothetical protein